MKHILVTGASKGIGKATAITLAKEGYHVAVHCHQSLDAAQSVVTQITQSGGSAYITQFDICNRQQCYDEIMKCLNKHGAFYGVIHNAGIHKDAAFPALEDEDWDNVIHTNLDSFYNVIKPIVMPMVRSKKGGRIITLASVSALVGNRGQVNYAAAKAGIIAASKSLALELAKRKITVNCVAPGLIETSMTEQLDHKEEIIKHIPLRRAGTVQEVADLIAFLMSDKSAYITREVISINGGLA